MKYLMLLALLCTAVLAQADETISWPGRYKVEQSTPAKLPATVDIRYQWLLFPAQMQWKLQKNRYVLDLNLNVLGHGRRYLSEGRLASRRVEPLRFSEFRDGSATPSNFAEFDWQAGQATLGGNDNRQPANLSEGDQDLFSVALQLALRKEQGAMPALALFKGDKRYEGVVFAPKQQAVLKLGEASVPVVQWHAEWDDRQMDFWLVPQWQNVPIRMVLKLGEGVPIDIRANEIKLDGRMVLQRLSDQPGQAGR